MTDFDISNLLSRMSLEEKLGQLSLHAGASEEPGADPINPVLSPRSIDQHLVDVRAGRVTGFFNLLGVDNLLPLQRAAVEESRLGIPLIFAADIIHGCRTIFPVPLAEAASWNVELARRTAEAAAREAAAEGIAWTFAPGVDIGRDARWGRIIETSGEDVGLACRFARARVEGFQGPDLADRHRIMATAKHFAAYGAAEGGLDYATADISMRTLREHYLPPFLAAVESGVGSVMTAFNDVEGVPCTANALLLRKILREEWGFEGVVVSDYASDIETIAHGYAATPREAARLSLLAGLDMSMESGLFMTYGVDLVESGDVPIAIIDQAVARILWMKQRLGLFSDPYNRLTSRTDQRPDFEQCSRALAREAAASSVVLLKNDNDLLPLGRGARIALVGPFADDHDHLNGAWSNFGDSGASISLKTGLAAQFGSDYIVCAKGCEIEGSIDGGIEAALAIVADADVVILAIGEGQHMSGECRSLSDISLPEAQKELVRAIKKCGKPLVALVKTGRPLPLEWLVEQVDAVLVMWFLGSETGNGIADLLCGNTRPSGRLPVSFPRSAGQVPIYYNRKSTGRPVIAGEVQHFFKARYQDVADTPLFPFGFGLTYGKVVYEAARLSSSTLTDEQSIKASVIVKNNGPLPCLEIVQLYIRDVAASFVRPLRQLVDFKSVQLEPGQSVSVEFEVTETDLRFLQADGRLISEPGAFLLWLAPDAERGTPVQFELIKCHTKQQSDESYRKKIFIDSGADF